LLSIIQLKEKAIELLSMLPDFTESELMVRFGRTIEDCVPYIEVGGGSYIWQLYERGKCIKKKETANETEALFWILEDYISDYSINYEVRHRDRYKSSRRLMFQTQSKMFSYIGEPYYSMNEKQIAEMLERYPYDDNNTLALDLTDDFEETAKTLREKSSFGFLHLLYSAECNKNINFFIKKPYRDKYGGMENFKEVFTTVMMPKYKIIIDEMRKRNLPDDFQCVLYKMDRIEEKMKEFDVNALDG